MNVIFLDFDGPIITGRAQAAGMKTDPVAVRAIRDALAVSQAMLVVSSTHRFSGLHHCIEILNAVEDSTLHRYLHTDWEIRGRDDHPFALNRGVAIREWLLAHDLGWSDALVIDDYPIQSFHPLARQIHCDVDDGIGKEQLTRLAEWAAERRAAL